MKQFLKNLVTAEGRLSRIGFLHSFLFVLCLFILVSLIDDVYLRHSTGDLTVYLYVNSLQYILLMALWTPSMVKRLHDLDIRGNRVWIAWAGLLLSPQNLILLDIHIAAVLIDLQTVLFLFYGAVLVFYLMLFTVGGTTGKNNWGPPQLT